jgi:hypothetical protein
MDSPQTGQRLLNGGRTSWLVVVASALSYFYVYHQMYFRIPEDSSQNSLNVKVNLHDNSSSNDEALLQNVNGFRLEDFQFFNPTVQPLPPVKAMEQYIQWHSVESLHRQPHNRTFAVAYYSCPLQAGNRLHHFMNDLLFAMATNRTVLWKYWDRESCMQLGNTYDQNVCSTSTMNTLSDCDSVLERAPWIPSFEEWSVTLDLPPAVEVFEGGLQAPRSNPHSQRVPWIDKKTKRYGPASNWPLVVFQPKVGAMKSVSKIPGVDFALKYFPYDKNAQSVIANLFHLGNYFMYGMMFHKSFSLTSTILSSVAKAPPTSDALSFAIHSRHADPDDDGSDVSKETECLSNLMANNHNVCQVYIMSDRRKTLSSLRRWLRSHHCSIVEAEHEKGGSFEGEHGPFAGIGFFQDLLVASQARSGYVGNARSSSKLLYEWIEYFRAMEYWSKGLDMTKHPAISHCLMSG